MYAVTVHLEIKPDRMDSFLPLMMENARRSRETETGCQQFDVCRDGDTVFLYEIYDDRAAFDEHLASAHFRAFDAAVAPMVAEKVVTLYEEVLR
jgi:quinol monooxygenase YgiN